MRLSKALVKVAALAFLTAWGAWSAPVPYGDFIGPTLSFIDVQVDDGTATAWPAPGFGGTSLDFDPDDFVAAIVGDGSDTINTLITFGLAAVPGVGIKSMSILQKGDASLLGSGSAATQAIMAASAELTVLEVDGAPIAPISVLNNGSVGFNLLSNPGMAQPWSLGLGFTIDSFLTSKGVPFTTGATKVLISYNPELTAMGERSSSSEATIKDIVISAVTVGDPIPGVPEPATFCISGLGLSLIVLLRRRIKRISRR